MKPRLLISGSLYVVIMTLLGALAAWPIYQSPAMILVIAAAAIVGAGLAWVSRRFSWPVWLDAAGLVGAWIILGVAVAVPARWASGTVFPGALLDVVTGPITGFKDLITVPLPVGEYRNLLVPLLVVFLVCVHFAARLSWQGGNRAALAVPIAAIMPAFGLLFGRTVTSAPLTLGPLTIPAPVETLVGATAILVSVIWLAWRARDDRRAALRRAEAATGISSTSGPTPGAAVRRGALAASMVVIALVAGVAVTPLLADQRPRAVLRSTIGPDLSHLVAASPLADYRNNFADTAYGQTLFTLESSQKLPARIRLATLSDYDGEVYRVASNADDAFQRVPAQLPVPPGETSKVTVTIEGLRGEWLPTFGALERIDFTGSDATALADDFYYDATTGTAVEADGLAEGDTYVLTAVEQKPGDLASAKSPGAKAPIALPKNMQRWLEQQDATRSGAGLLQIITTLRERGYLSHALSRSEETPLWMKDLGDYTFRPSAAGHSLARVDQLFRQLLDRETQAGADGDESSLVGAIGDDEQFAVAGALIAQQLGFPSRVVLGVRTDDPDLPSCEDGACRAGDVSAWIEVRLGAGEWVAVDTTPQYKDKVTTETRRERDPENMTDVRPNTAQEVAPPDPQRQETNEVPPTPNPGADLTVLWNVLRITGISLLGLIILLAPFIVVLIAKALRRKGRRGEEDPARAIAGGWDEYVDAAVDAGRPAPTSETRRELATMYATPGAATLADTADHAVFSGAAVGPEENERFWEIVADERRALHEDLGWFARLRAALSLKSFRRQFAAITPRPGASFLTRLPERRKRRDSGA